jgi:hypothetical protein
MNLSRYENNGHHGGSWFPRMTAKDGADRQHSPHLSVLCKVTPLFGCEHALCHGVLGFFPWLCPIYVAVCTRGPRCHHCLVISSDVFRTCLRHKRLRERSAKVRELSPQVFTSSITSESFFWHSPVSRILTTITDQCYWTMSLEPGLYRILAPIDSANSLGYVATSGDNVGDPVTLSLSQPKNLHELVSFLVSDILIKPVLICDAYSG